MTYCGTKCRLCIDGTKPHIEPPKLRKKKTELSNIDPRAMSEAGSAMETLGTVPIPESSKRDAIHIAVFPVVAQTRLIPGMHVDKDGTTFGEFIGIVDPFLEKIVEPGQRVWVYLYPRTITGLRHVWTHPSFEDETVENSSAAPKQIIESTIKPMISYGEERLREYAKNLGVDYEDLISNAESYFIHGDYWSDGDRFDGEYIPKEFWDWIEDAKVFDMTRKSSKFFDRGSFFSCSC